MRIDSESRHTGSAAAQSRITRADGSPIRAVVVDDEDSLTDLLSMALRYEGWEVKVAHGGQKAPGGPSEILGLFCRHSGAEATTGEGLRRWRRFERGRLNVRYAAGGVDIVGHRATSSALICEATISW